MSVMGLVCVPQVFGIEVVDAGVVVVVAMMIRHLPVVSFDVQRLPEL